MKLMPSSVASGIPKFYETEDVSVNDKVIYVKYFCPWNQWTWYVAEYDGDGLCFGYVEGLDNEWGYFSIAELENITGDMGLKIERDLYFDADTFGNLVSSGIITATKKYAPQSWVANEKIWAKATVAFKKSYGKDPESDSDFAIVAAIYEKMGGKVKKSRRKRISMGLDMLQDQDLLDRLYTIDEKVDLGCASIMEKRDAKALQKEIEKRGLYSEKSGDMLKLSLEYMTERWIRAILSNDEFSTDEELTTMFMNEGGLTKEEAIEWLGERDHYLNNLVEEPIKESSGNFSDSDTISAWLMLRDILDRSDAGMKWSFDKAVEDIGRGEDKAFMLEGILSSIAFNTDYVDDFVRLIREQKISKKQVVKESGYFYEYFATVEEEDMGEVRELLEAAGYKWDSYGEHDDMGYNIYEFTSEQYEDIKDIIDRYVIGWDYYEVDESGQSVSGVDKDTIREHKISKKISKKAYETYEDSDGDLVYKLPYSFNSIEELIAIRDEDLEEFLHGELGSGDLVESLEGEIFVGMDIFDFLTTGSIEKKSGEIVYEDDGAGVLLKGFDIDRAQIDDMLMGINDIVSFETEGTDVLEDPRVDIIEVPDGSVMIFYPDELRYNNFKGDIVGLKQIYNEAISEYVSQIL